MKGSSKVEGANGMPGVVTVGMDIERKWQPVRASGMPEAMRTGMESYFTASATLDCGLKNEYQPLTAMVWQQKFQLLQTIASFLLIVPFFIPPSRASRLRCAQAVATAGDMVGGSGFNSRRGLRGGKGSTNFTFLAIFGGVW